MQITSTAQLKGRTVLEAGGQVVGTLDEVMIDTESWSVAGIRLRLRREVGKEIGASGGMFGMFQGAALEIPIHMVAAARDAVILSVPLARLRELAQQKGPLDTAKEASSTSDQPDPAIP